MYSSLANFNLLDWQEVQALCDPRSSTTVRFCHKQSYESALSPETSYQEVFHFQEKEKKYPPSLIPPSSMSKVVSKFPGLKIRTNLKKKKCLEAFQHLNTQDTDFKFFFLPQSFALCNSRRQELVASHSHSIFPSHFPLQTPE